MPRARACLLVLTSLCGASCATTPAPRPVEWRPLAMERPPTAEQVSQDRAAFLGHLGWMTEDRLHRAGSHNRAAKLLYATAAFVMLTHFLWSPPDEYYLGVLYAAAPFGGGAAVQRMARDHRRCSAFIASARDVFDRKWSAAEPAFEANTWREYRSDQNTILRQGPC